MAAPLRVLVIDDDEGVRRLVSAVLQRDGHQVTLASTGTEGLQRIDEAPVDLVITDKNLGDFNGLEIVAKIRAKNPTLPIVLMTGAPEKMTGAQMPDAYLAKPFRTLATLTQAVDDALEQQRVAALRRKAREQLDALREQFGPALAGASR